MNSVSSRIAKSFIKTFFRSFLFAFCFFAQVRVHAQEVPAVRQPDSELAQALRQAVKPVEPVREIVILNTENGFVPAQVRVTKGVAYKVHVVNLNMKEKNVSFLMDSFSQSHNTVFGVRKTFNIEPQVEGVYSYQCPETGIEGRIVVTQEPASRRVASYGD